MDGVYPVSVTKNAEGDQIPAIVFRDPVAAAEASYAFPLGYLIAFDPDVAGGVVFPTNDDGVTPYRERTSDEEDLGLTWQLPK